LPDLAEDELLVRIKACGIYGSDLHMYRLGMFETLGRQAAAGLRSLLAGNMQNR
jgi:threonine dehydrogenase-like Zn-dependent dehydrogenase